MKRPKALFAILFCAGASLAAQELQKAPQQSPAIPAKGNVMLEFNFKPFGNDKLISFDNFQGKWRTSDHVALRLGLQVGNIQNDMSNNDYDQKVQYPSTYSEKSFNYGIMPGIEYHFLKNSKISPYMGLEVTYKKRNSSSVYEDYATSSSSNNAYQKYDVDGGWRGTEYYTYYYNGQEYTDSYTTYDNNRSNHSLGTNLLLGSDFYLLKNMYLGFEIGLGYNYQKFEKITLTTTSSVEPAVAPSYHMTSLKFIYNNSIRLGIWF